MAAASGRRPNMTSHLAPSSPWGGGMWAGHGSSPWSHAPARAGSLVLCSFDCCVAAEDQLLDRDAKEGPGRMPNVYGHLFVE